MRICLVSEYYPPWTPGGAEWSTQALAGALAEAGHDVLVVTPNWGGAAEENAGRLRIARFWFPRHLPPGRKPVPARWLANPLFYAYAAFAVARAARRHRAEVIHVQTTRTLIPGVRAGRRLGVPVLATVRDASIIDAAPVCLHHGDQMPADCGVRKLWGECAPEYIAQYGTPGRPALVAKLAFLYFWLDARLKQRFLRRVSAVIGVSDGILGVYRRSGLLEGVRTHTVYTIPPPSAPPPPETVTAWRERLGLGERPVVLFVGKRSPGKGATDFARAAEQVVARVPGAVFVFAGADRRDALPDVADDHLRVLEPLPNRDVLALYRLATVTAVPSLIPDAFSRVILESLAAGCPVVATRVGGTPELVIDGVTGLLVQRSAPDELAKALVSVLEDGTLRARLADGARRHVAERFGAAGSIERLEAIYAEAIGRAGAPSVEPAAHEARRS